MTRPIAAVACAATFLFRHASSLDAVAERRVLSLNNKVIQSLDKAKSKIDSKLFLYQTPAYQWIPSSVYRYDDFKESLSVMANEGVAGKKFYMGDDDVENGHVYGLVNIAAFLAQSMKETIQYDACDENSWDLVGGKYPLSNACGQLGQSYQDYKCSPEEAHMECPVDPNMSIKGVTHAKWYGAPGPMFCGPKSEYPFSGFWDHNYECNRGWANPPESCDVYEGQKAGRYDHSISYANTAGRSDVEGCCWWGRGVIQTSGVCNFGKLNYYLGAGAKKDGRPAKYPQVDFCKDPEVICASPEYKELKWIAGEFYWMESVQSYNEGGWDYTTELRKFVQGGMTGNGFINGVSGIVNRGCHNPPCGTGALDGGMERAQNFKKALDMLFDGSPPKVGPSPGDSPPGTPGTPGSGPSPAQTPPTTRHPVSPTSEAGKIINSETFIEMENTLNSVKNEIDNKLFLYQTPAYQWIASSVYRYNDFKESLYVMATEGVAGKKFYIGESDVKNGHVYGLVNIAAFLAQSMKETIQYDACDENSWDLVGGKYPLSNACGQLGQSYQDYKCSPEEAHMECPVDPNMSIKGVTHAKWYGAPGPMFCGPKSEYPFSGIWNHNYECNRGWANPPESCDDYEGQKAGKYDHSISYANTAGRTDVEGCCWWGRGVIQTSGVCNFGKLNYYLGAGAKKDGRPAKYPQVDFCKDPEVICSSSEYKELKWIAGEFYWMESVQSYNEGGWDYTTELRKFVDGGMTGTGFIDGVSGIVNRGCHNPPCGTGPVDGGWERAQNFRKVLDVFFGGSPPQVGPSPSGSPPGSLTDSGPTAGSGTSTGRWYPDYNAQWALGKCVNDAPIPGGRPSYDTGDDCCQRAYGNQASGMCLSSLTQGSIATGSSLLPGNSIADAFATSLSTHSRQQSNFISYSCGANMEIPMNSLVVDILFDYEVSVSDKVQPGHLLPNLKKQIMGDLAHALGCKAVLRRNLRNFSEREGLLGFRSAAGSDVIDGEKGSCSQSGAIDKNDERCIPVIGHLAAFIQRDASVQAVIETKNVILRSIHDGITRNNYVNLTGHIVYLSEHGQAQKDHPNDQNSVEEYNKNTNATYIIIGCVLLAVAVFSVVAVLLLKGKRENKKGVAEIHNEKEETSVSAVGDTHTTHMSLYGQLSEVQGSAIEDISCHAGIECDVSSSLSTDSPTMDEALDVHSSAISTGSPPMDEVLNIQPEEHLVSFENFNEGQGMNINSDEDMKCIASSCHNPNDLDAQNGNTNGPKNFGTVLKQHDERVNFPWVNNSNEDISGHNEPGSALDGHHSISLTRRDIV